VRHDSDVVSRQLTYLKTFIVGCAPKYSLPLEKWCATGIDDEDPSTSSYFTIQWVIGIPRSRRGCSADSRIHVEVSSTTETLLGTSGVSGQKHTWEESVRNCAPSLTFQPQLSEVALLAFDDIGHIQLVVKYNDFSTFSFVRLLALLYVGNESWRDFNYHKTHSLKSMSPVTIDAS